MIQVLLIGLLITAIWLAGLEIWEKWPPRR